MKIAHFTSGVVRLLFVIVTLQPPLPAARPTTPRLFPVVTQKLTAPAVGGVVHAVVAVYLTESAKYASSAVTRFRRSDFIEAMYAFAFVLANFGIAMAAKMPMMTTTISNSMSVANGESLLIDLVCGNARNSATSVCKHSSQNRGNVQALRDMRVDHACR